MPVERRSLERYELQASTEIALMASTGEVVLPHLLTRDISSSGAFVLTRVQLPVGSDVRVRFVLHSRSAGGKPQRKARVNVNGQVVRMDSDGVAIRFAHRFSITRFGGKAPEYSDS
jgi:hypothetical protein